MTNQNTWNEFPNLAYVSNVYPNSRYGYSSPNEFAQAWGRENALENELEFSKSCVTCLADTELKFGGVSFCEECKPLICAECKYSTNEFHLNIDGFLVCRKCVSDYQTCPSCGVSDEYGFDLAGVLHRVNCTIFKPECEWCKVFITHTIDETLHGTESGWLCLECLKNNA